MNKTRKVILAVCAILLTATLVSATLLPFFGQVNTTANVEQAIVIGDNTGWHNYNEPITYTIPEPAPGGETFCKEQWIWNKASIPVAVSLDTNVYAGITTTYSIPAVYSYSHDIAGVNVTVVDTGDGWLQWTYTGDNTTREVPKMTVAINYPNGFAITTFDDGSHNGWYYAPDPDVESSRVLIGPYSGASWDWVQAAASGHVMIVKILKSHLAGEECNGFKWHGYANFYNAQVWINANGTGSGYHIPQFVVNLWQQVTAPFTLQSHQQLQFRICYAFALNIGPGQYILTTTVNANEIPS